MSQKESTETQQACMVLTSYLSSHRMRKTPERYEILKAVHQFAEPFDINQIQEKLKDSTMSISLSTIYNTFTLLENAQLLVRTKPNGRYNKYMDAAKYGPANGVPPRRAITRHSPMVSNPSVTHSLSTDNAGSVSRENKKNDNIYTIHKYYHT